MLVTSIFSFFHNVFKTFYSRGVKSRDCVVKSQDRCIGSTIINLPTSLGIFDMQQYYVFSVNMIQTNNKVVWSTSSQKIPHPKYNIVYCLFFAPSNSDYGTFGGEKRYIEIPIVNG